MTEDWVWTAGPGEHGSVGRYHIDPLCWAMGKPRRDYPTKMRTLAEADQRGHWQCPMCDPQTTCEGKGHEHELETQGATHS